MKENTAAIRRRFNRAKSIRSLQDFDDSQSSFHSAQQSVAYDLAQPYGEQLVQSSAYQRAQTAAAEELFAAKLELLEEKYELGTVPLLSLLQCIPLRHRFAKTSLPEEKLDNIRLEVALKDEKVVELENAVSLKNELGKVLSSLFKILSTVNVLIKIQPEKELHRLRLKVDSKDQNFVYLEYILSSQDADIPKLPSESSPIAQILHGYQ